MHQRLAIVTGLALLLGAVLFAFVPANAGGTKCGWWVAPEWSESESRKLADDAMELSEEMSDTPGGEDLAAQTAGIAMSAATNYRKCTDKLSTRRTLSLGLLAAAVLLPAGILYVAKREDETATP